MSAPFLDRRHVVERVLQERGDRLVVTGLGSSCWDAAAAGDSARTFYLWGAMGSAALVGLGLALAQPHERVMVLTGDGEMLMGLGALATVSVARPANLAILVLDNERYGETGNQPTHTGHAVDLAKMAAAAGFSTTFTARAHDDLPELVRLMQDASGPVFTVAKISDAPVPLVLPPRDGTYLKHRFREALLGAGATR